MISGRPVAAFFVSEGNAFRAEPAKNGMGPAMDS
jgi:hypothetical protein